MNFTITGRNVTVSDKLTEYVGKKIPRLEKYFHQLMEVRVIIFVEKQDHVAEMVLTGDGVQFYGQEKGGDFYSAVDLILDKVEKQLVRFKEKHQEHKGIPLGEMPVVNINDEDTREIIVEEASAKPNVEAEAYLEMKLEKRDFILFKKGERDINGGVDYENRNYAVLFDNSGELRLAEVSVDALKKPALDDEDIIEYTVIIKGDSPSDPKLVCTKSKGRIIRRMTINDALVELVVSGRPYMPYLNSETDVMNIIYSSGKDLGVVIPASK